jgi:hypothetical protein
VKNNANISVRLMIAGSPSFWIQFHANNVTHAIILFPDHPLTVREIQDPFAEKKPIRIY